MGGDQFLPGNESDMCVRKRTTFPEIGVFVFVLQGKSNLIWEQSCKKLKSCPDGFWRKPMYVILGTYRLERRLIFVKAVVFFPSVVYYPSTFSYPIQYVYWFVGFDERANCWMRF